MQPPSRQDNLTEQTHRDAVDVAIELVEDDKTSTWTGILKKSHGQIRPWAEQSLLREPPTGGTPSPSH